MATPSGAVQPFSTGASYVYLGLGGGKSGTPLFFGTCEGFPKHERKPEFMQLMNDVGGRRKPIDMSFQGQDATISLTMTVWDEGMYQMLQSFPDFKGGAGAGLNTPGIYRFADVGALMGMEQLSFKVIIAYGFGSVLGAKTAYAKLPAGIRYLQCIPFNTDGTDEGAQPMKRHVMFYCWPVCDFQAQRHTLYDYDLTGLPAPTNGPTIA